jgi:predicted SnoaL-like aldol condensation-catalyzing enzyme
MIKTTPEQNKTLVLQALGLDDLGADHYGLLANTSGADNIVSGTGRPRSWIAADVVRVVDGVLAEHWDVLQDEATKAESRSGLPMFGTTFPE